MAGLLNKKQERDDFESGYYLYATFARPYSSFKQVHVACWSEAVHRPNHAPQNARLENDC